MRDSKNRTDRLEKEYQFRLWFHFQRLLESFPSEQLETYAAHGRFPQPPPEPLPRGASQLDKLDRKSLTEMWQKDERRYSHFLSRSSEDKEFFCIHGHWPEKANQQHSPALTKQIEMEETHDGVEQRTEPIKMQL